MIDTLLANPVAVATVMVLAGVGLGLAYLGALRRTVEALAHGAGWRMPMALTVARLAAAAGLLFLAAKLGAIPLLATFAGFLLARSVILRRVRRAS